MKKETKELARTLCIALAVMMAVPVAYRVFVHFWPPEERPRQSITQFFDAPESESGEKLLAKPVAKWTEAEKKAEPAVYAWLQGQGSEILPWEWTDEARKKDPKGYAKCWRRIWNERKLHYEKLLAQHQKDIKRLEREAENLAVIYDHRTNQIARLHSIAATNDFPCKVAVERLEKGRFWGWNKRVEMVECSDAAEIVSVTNSICSREVAIAQEEDRTVDDLFFAGIALGKIVGSCENALEICNENSRLAEIPPSQEEGLRKAFVENLKRE